MTGETISEAEQAKMKAKALNAAAIAMGLGTAGMTSLRWSLLTQPERDKLVDLCGLSPQLIGMEHDYVEVDTMEGERRRFWVARSSGWQPCHIERKRRNSSGGLPADNQYRAVRLLRFSNGEKAT